MKFCKYSHYEFIKIIQFIKYTNMLLCNYAIIKLWIYAINQLYIYANNPILQLYKLINYTNMQIDNYAKKNLMELCK